MKVMNNIKNVGIRFLRKIVIASKMTKNKKIISKDVVTDDQ